MNKYIYDAKTNAFYPLSLKEEYETSDTWPENGIEVDETVFVAFLTAPAGKVRVAGSDGKPAWGDIPPPTPEQAIAIAEHEKQLRLAYANNVTADWRTELALGSISDDDKARLIAWMAYIKELKSVDTSTAPGIKWPDKPE
ncbi:MULTISPECIES: tail fiber assembly protein [Citrobacter freundii complex]|uniref:tail fiber assembly protein n=1 Tax=Citrobacter freundii complex TaxID=1344959 RepID=UPI001BCB8EB9|nr:tail fiber assembly protein [Citrobacter freundii]